MARVRGERNPEVIGVGGGGEDGRTIGAGHRVALLGIGSGLSSLMLAAEAL